MEDEDGPLPPMTPLDFVLPTLSSSLALGWFCFFLAAVALAVRFLELAALALAAPAVPFEEPFFVLAGGSGAGRFAGAVVGVGVRAGEGVGRRECEAEVGWEWGAEMGMGVGVEVGAVCDKVREGSWGGWRLAAGMAGEGRWEKRSNLAN